MTIRPDDYDGSYCIQCRQPFPEMLHGFECPNCGYFDDGLLDEPLYDDHDSLEARQWMDQCDSERDENFRQLEEWVGSQEKQP